jgi:hypothetical protein
MARLELTLTTKSLSNTESSSIKNVIVLKGNQTKEINLLLFSQDQCRIKLVLSKNFSKILEKFANKKLKCDTLKKDYENLLLSSRMKKMKESEMTQEELEKSLVSQVETVEKKYELEEQIKKCSKKTTLSRFRKLKKSKLIFHLNNGKKFEIEIKNRNLVGEIKILPEEPVVNVLFPGPNRHFKFEVLNTFGKVLKILKVVNKPLKIALFEAYSSKKFISSSPKPGNHH